MLVVCCYGLGLIDSQTHSFKYVVNKELQLLMIMKVRSESRTRTSRYSELDPTPTPHFLPP